MDVLVHILQYVDVKKGLSFCMYGLALLFQMAWGVESRDDKF